METEWEEDDGEGGVRQSFRPPWWYRPNTQPCECSGPVEALDTHTGYSDSQFIRWRCTICGHSWCSFLEG